MVCRHARNKSFVNAQRASSPLVSNLVQREARSRLGCANWNIRNTLDAVQRGNRKSTAN